MRSQLWFQVLYFLSPSNSKSFYIQALAASDQGLKATTEGAALS